MSRIGNAVIDLPSGIELKVNPNSIDVKGPKGSLAVPLFDGIQVNIKDNRVSIKRSNDVKDLKAKHGLVRALLANCIQGTHEGFRKILIMEGVGYRAKKKGKQLILSLGYSHDTTYDEPEDIHIEVEESVKIIISGIDKQRVGEVAAQIRKLRKPEPYKGKGIHYEGEKIRRKAGKVGKK